MRDATTMHPPRASAPALLLAQTPLKFRGGAVSQSGASALRASGVPLAMSVPVLASVGVIGLMILLSPHSAASSRSSERPQVTASLVSAGIGALLIFVALQLNGESLMAPLSALSLVAGAALSWVYGFSAAEDAGGGSGSPARRARLRAAATAAALSALLVALVAPLLVAALLPEGRAAAKRAAASAGLAAAAPGVGLPTRPRASVGNPGMT